MIYTYVDQSRIHIRYPIKRAFYCSPNDPSNRGIDVTDKIPTGPFHITKELFQCSQNRDVLIVEKETPMYSGAIIILRYTNNKKTDALWRKCYTHARKVYPKLPIFIVDDYSNFKSNRKTRITNCALIQSDLSKGRGEFLPYYFMLIRKIAKRVLFIHDSFIMNRRIPIFKKVGSLFTFSPRHCEKRKDTRQLLTQLPGGDELMKIYMKYNWQGCFGGMAVIEYKWLCILEQQYKFTLLHTHIQNRIHRMAFERIIGLFFSIKGIHKPLIGKVPEYMKTVNGQNAPFHKVFNGR